MKPVVQVNLVSSQLWVELLFISYEAKYDKKKKTPQFSSRDVWS